jgi:hypothetical protein
MGGGKESSILQGYCDAEYVGGHVEYPSLVHTKVLMYSDKIVLQSLGVEIDYLSMTNIENVDEQRLSAGRVVGLGLIFPVLAVVGAMWKKKHRYTVIQYMDGPDIRAVVLDFGDKIDSAQPLIYHRMVSFKKSDNKQLREGYLVYENTKHGLRMEYPSHWVRDDLEQESEDYVCVVQFREVVENKPPYITLYVNTPTDSNISLQDFFYDQLKDEINKAYKFGLFTSVIILSRKLIEDLIIDVLRSKSPTNNPNKSNFNSAFITIVTIRHVI